MKKFKYMLVLFTFMVLCLSGCAGPATDRWPRVCLQPTHWSMDETIVPAKEGFVISTDCPYEIVETNTGYDMIIHFTPEVLFND